MTAKIAINGMGRIGRAALKIVLDTPELELVAVNDLSPMENIIYLLKYDTVYGRYGKTVEKIDNDLVIDGRCIDFFTERDPLKLPWGSRGVDIVLECTGAFVRRGEMAKHLAAGAKHVMLSAPAKGDGVPTVVHGVNTLDPGEPLISCASCTTNCTTPVFEIMSRRIGVVKGMVTAIHAYTGSQNIVDSTNKHYERGRAGVENFVPTYTGASEAATRVLPELEGLFDGVAVRAPVPVGSLAEIMLVTQRKTSVEEVNRIFEEEAGSERYRDIVGVTHDPIVSSDIIMDTHASTIDLRMTGVVGGDLVRVMSWYDNEWGFTSQMVREAVRIARSITEKV